MEENFLALLEEQHDRLRRSGETMPIDEVAARIVALTSNMADFWSKPLGWVPREAAALLVSARIDRVASLARSLARWSGHDDLEDGDLILAWVTLGALVEGALRLFLCVYFADYSQDQSTRRTRAWNIKHAFLQDPDQLKLDTILDYADKAQLLAPRQLEMARMAQARRNAVHAFRDREIGIFPDFLSYQGALIRTHGPIGAVRVT